MSSQALSTAPYGLVMRRAFGRALVISTAVVLLIFAVAFAPVAIADPDGFLRAITRVGSFHAPDFTPIAQASLPIQIHLATIVAALIATAVLMIGVKGARLHRALGWGWSAAMVTTAVSALFIQAAPFGPHIGPFGVLHVFALMTLVSVPRAVLAARRHDVARHAGILAGFVVGGLGIAGLAAFLPGRLVWAVFFG